MLSEMFLDQFLNNHLLERGVQVRYEKQLYWEFWRNSPSHPQQDVRSNYHLFNRSWLFASFSFREPLTKDLHQHEPNVSRQAFTSQEGPGSSAPVIGHKIHSPQKDSCGATSWKPTREDGECTFVLTQLCPCWLPTCFTSGAKLLLSQSSVAKAMANLWVNILSSQAHTVRSQPWLWHKATGRRLG